MSDFKNILIKKESFCGTITINRPEVYGALTREAKLEIIKAIRELNKDQGIGCIILTSNGKAFCSGQDLNDRTVQAGDRPVDLGQTLNEEWNPLVKAIRESKKIVIGAINGVCAGAGVSVALACDLIVTHPSVKFVSGFSKLGLCPDAGSTKVFTDALGAKKAMEFFLLGKPLEASSLLNTGLINEIDENFLDKANLWASMINGLGPLCVEMIKSNINACQDLSYNDAMEREVHAQRFLGNSEDYKEGLQAFFEKRPAKFIGK